MRVQQLNYPQLYGGFPFVYCYDGMGNITTYHAPGESPVTYTYDNQGQLKNATDGTTTYSYTYDGAGNLLTANGHTYTYTNTNWRDILNQFDGEKITYDSDGNPTSYYNGTRWTFSWGNSRRLETATNGTTSASYNYTADGVRTSKTVDGVTHTYYYSGTKLLRETYGTTVLDFFYDANGTPYALKQGSTTSDSYNTYYYVTNLQGDVIRLVDIYGNIAAMYKYDPFGNTVHASGSHATINPLRYRGYYYDTETCLYYLQSRYYDPAIGRFINADVLISTGQGMLGNNMFAYCRNNPICRVDITGTADADCYDNDPLDEEDMLKARQGGGGYFDAQQAILDGNFVGGYSYGGSNYNLLPSWITTGRSLPSDLNEQIAMKAARTNPQSGKVIKETLSDPRLSGYAKYARFYPTSKGGIEVHYVGNPETNTFGDFKFK